MVHSTLKGFMKRSQTLIYLDRLIRASFYALIFFLPIGIGLVSTFSAFAVFFFLVKRIFAGFKHGRGHQACQRLGRWPGERTACASSRAGALQVP